MVHTFHCPACNARLEYDGDDDPIVQCAYCNSAVIVPEEIRARRSTPSVDADFSPIFDHFFKLDFSDLTNLASTLKTVKELIHDGREAEAIQLYQEKFQVSEAEAEQFVNALASGQSMVASNVFSLDMGQAASFSAMFPIAGGAASQVQISTGPGIQPTVKFQTRSEIKRPWRFIVGMMILLLALTILCLGLVFMFRLV
jgi:hypothetical protein